MAYKITQELCSACHRCRMECPVHAIRFKNAKYWIDPEKCISCGKCVAVCHNECISDPEHPKAPAPAHEKVIKECDVCVLGAGGSGMMAANKAQDLGAKVVLLEKMHEVGGSSWYAAGFRTHWSKKHAELGFQDNREELYLEFMEKTGYRDNPKLVRRMFEANEQFADWLMDEHDIGDEYQFERGGMGHGKEFVVLKPQRAWKDAAKRIDKMIGPGEAGSFLAEHMQDEFLKGGGEILFHTAAKKLLMNADGSVCGVLADDPGGEVEIHCKAVVVATGAFSRNKELMNKFQPLFYDDEGKEPIHIFTGAGCTGDGITMCDEIGADIDYINRRVNMFGPMRHPYPSASMAAYLAMDGFKITSEGKIFHDHMGVEVSPLISDPKWMGWKIADDTICETALEESMQEPPQSPGMDLPAFQKHWREIFAEEALDNSIVMADSIPELAEKLGIDPVEFQKNVDEYNASAGKPVKVPEGMPDFMAPKHSLLPIQKAPFYAIKMKIFHEDAIGGMTIDENASVLRFGEPIPGLYAAGDTTRGIMVSGDIGVDYLESIFSALTMAYDEGYIAGTEAGKYATGIKEG